MSSNVESSAGETTQPADDDIARDARVERSARALQQAMRELLHERPFADITVQHIIDRAGVSRGTFYSRFRNKDDALFNSVERMFGGFEAHLTSNPRDLRLAPVAELLEHLSTAGAVRHSLESSGRLDEIWGLFTDFIADCIERRMPIVAPGASTSPTSVPVRVSARMLAGALMEMMEWWMDRQTSATPTVMDAEFHRMARRMLGADGVRA